eukprot:767075-Hanusia_phi.AAC.2
MQDLVATSSHMAGRAILKLLLQNVCLTFPGPENVGNQTEQNSMMKEGESPGIQIAFRTRPNNPLLLLTVKLLDTYQGINEKYYAKQDRRHNDGYDDENGDYIIRPGDLINNRYKIVTRSNGSSPLLGKGSFGQVVYAIDTTESNRSKQHVAIKITKNHRHWHEQAKSEIALLKKLRGMNSVIQNGISIDWVDYANVVKLIDDFVHKNHCCLVFELLPFTLYDLLKYSKYKGVSLQLVSKFAKHLVKTLDCLRQPELDVIHCDLKPENVMLVRHDDHRVKVIDFGSSCSSKRQPFTYIQSRFYRSPEVLLCHPYSYPIDMWSLGCILVEMHTGQPLFNGKNEAEQMFKICDVLGMPPIDMVKNAGSKSKVKSCFKLDESRYYIVVDSKVLERATRDFRQIIRKPSPPPYSPEQEAMYNMFEDLILKMLTYDPSARITPKEAMLHPFLQGQETLTRVKNERGEGNQGFDTPVAKTPRADKVDQASQTNK